MTEVVIIGGDEKKQSKRRLWLWIPLGIVAILAIVISGFSVWALNPLLEINPIAIEALEDADDLTVTDSRFISFLPHTPPEVGYIIYPGGRVPATAYAPLARQIAEAGHLVVLAKAPINLAILNPNLANPIMEFYSAVDTWVVGGHSLGGSVAAIYADNNPEIVSGVVFMASYPVDDSLIELNIPALSIYGTNDGIATLDEIDQSREDLPASTDFVAIQGGNHAQFGYYGEQSGDLPAEISHDAQINQTANATIRFLNSLREQN